MPADLERFVHAQDGCLDLVTAELRAGAKHTHWMWFIFPQLRGLGRSRMAQTYGLTDLDAARGYLAHPVLGPRLRTAVALLLAHPDRTADSMLGPVDALKLRSSATLFALAADDPAPFQDLLDTFFDGQPCPRTQQMLDPPA